MNRRSFLKALSAFPVLPIAGIAAASPSPFFTDIVEENTWRLALLEEERVFKDELKRAAAFLEY